MITFYELMRKYNPSSLNSQSLKRLEQNRPAYLDGVTMDLVDKNNLGPYDPYVLGQTYVYHETSKIS